jgi:hypothetical protein
MVAKAVEDRRSLLMLSFLQAHSLKSIRVKLITIYMLNVSDALLTFWLIGTGYFFEANLLLKKAVFDFDELFLVKILFPVVLLTWLYFRIHSATEKQLRLGKIAVNSVLLLYIFVNILHLVWVGFFLMLEFAYVS